MHGGVSAKQVLQGTRRQNGSRPANELLFTGAGQKRLCPLGHRSKAQLHLQRHGFGKTFVPALLPALLHPLTHSGGVAPLRDERHLRRDAM